ncbi:Dienelactone hydrolase family protein [Burkholderiales bacterium 8X]|nr:Dienelactone hydrolase family protein [Burkholderiales bacterium 8X]
MPDSLPYPIVERSFSSDAGGRKVPLAAWFPVCEGPRPLVLVGHGGSGDKRSDAVTDMIGPLVGRHGFVVAAIDGPVHGERRTQPAAPLEVRDEFRRLWEAGGSVEPMVADWQAAFDTLSELPAIDRSAVGYYGLSMGTAYGLPFLAQAGFIRAAVIGMWGTSRVHSARLVDDARRVQCPTLFSLQWNDEIFTREGQFEVFDALAAADKHMTIYPGGHVNPQGGRLAEIVAFLARQLSA